MSKGELKNGILTAVVPVKNFDNNRDTLETLVSKCKFFPINLVIVLDSDDEDEFSELNNLVSFSQNSNVKVIQKKFNSPGLARNAGIDLATTAWLAFWDADDFPDPGSYLEMINLCDREHTNICVGSYQTLNYKTRDTNFRQTNSEDKFSWLANPGIWRCVFSVSLIGKIRFTSLRLGEDIQFLAEVISRPAEWSFYQPAVYQYVINRNGQATSRRPTKEELLISFKKLVQTAENAGPKNLALYVLVSSRLLTIVKFPKTYLGCAGALFAGVFSGKLKLQTFILSTLRVASYKTKYRGV